MLLHINRVANTAAVVVILCATQSITFARSKSICRDRKEGYFYPDLNNCKKFFTCNHRNDTAESRTCDSVTYKYFSEEAQSCLSVDDHCFKCPTSLFSEQRVKGQCQQYIRCIDGIAEYLTCHKGLLFDDKIDACNMGILVRCDPCPISDRNKYILLPDPKHCDA